MNKIMLFLVLVGYNNTTECINSNDFPSNSTQENWIKKVCAYNKSYMYNKVMMC